MMIDLLQRQVPYEWTVKQQEISDGIKQIVLITTFLKIIDPKKRFELHTNASGIAVEAIISQEKRPIVFQSKKLSPTQQKLHVHEQEVFANVHAFKIWRHYLHGAWFTVYIDHHNLKYICNQQISRVDK